MTVLTATQNVCAVIGVDQPTVLFVSTEREHVELRALANEVAVRITEAADWTRLRKVATVTGDGSATSFALPDDYARMIKKARLWSTSQPSLSLRHEPDSDRWLESEVGGFNIVLGEWTIYGGELHIRPALATGETVRYFYVSNEVVPGGQEFSADSDAFVLSERLLTLGMIWQWKANKGQAYAEDMENYEAALSVAIGNDKGSNILTIGSGRVRGGFEYAFPHVVTP